MFVGHCNCPLCLVIVCSFFFFVGYCNCAICLAIVCSFSLLFCLSVIATVRCVLPLFVPLLLCLSAIATVRCVLALFVPFLFFFVYRLLQLCSVSCLCLFLFSSFECVGYCNCAFRQCSYVFFSFECVGYCNYALCLVIMPRHTIVVGIMVSRWTSVCLSVRRTSVFQFRMITLVNINRFSPHLVCALIL